jgi:four helix bundle protein
MQINSAKDLAVYRKGYELAMRVFRLSESFPPDERFALTSQIRRASRSICLNLREAWAKRRYEAHFISKLTDCDGENAETESCLDFALDSGYINASDHQALVGLCVEIGKMIGSMMLHPEKFLIRAPRSPGPTPEPLTSDL